MTSEDDSDVDDLASTADPTTGIAADRRRFLVRGAATTGFLLAGGTVATGLAAAEDEPRASVTFDDQTTAGAAAIVQSTSLEVPGYLTIHESRLLDGIAAPSIIGVTSYLEAGDHENVVVPFTRIGGTPVEPDGTAVTHTLIAVPHYENSDPSNEKFDFHGSPDDSDADLSDTAFTNGPKETDGLPNDGVNALADVTYLSRVSRDEIALSKYDHRFDELSEETTAEVETIYDRQPFAGSLTASDVLTRAEIADEAWDQAPEDLDDEARTVLEMRYDGQFVPARMAEESSATE